MSFEAQEFSQKSKMRRKEEMPAVTLCVIEMSMLPSATHFQEESYLYLFLMHDYIIMWSRICQEPAMIYCSAFIQTISVTW